MSLASGTRLGPYEILERIGVGGMGEVYRARDTKLKRDVAIKVLPEALATDTERRARFQHEAEVLATLSHPNIAAIYGLEDSTGTVALVMELVQGASLAEKIRTRGMPLREALNVAIQIACGLEAAHKVGIVHRDLKPSNVMVTHAGVVKLVDFGLAKLLDPPRSAFEETETIAARAKTEDGHILGTVAYMSPEQAQSKSVDIRSDVFSFGTMLYEMLSGARPFQGENKISTLAAILQQDPKPLADLAAAPVPREVERVILRCLRKDPDRRFQTASDLRIALEDLKEDSSAGRLGLMPAAAPARRPRWHWVIGTVAVLGLAGVGAWLLLTRVRPPVEQPLKQVTFEASIARDPALSPDGKLLAYASDRSGEDQLDIWLKQMAGGDPVRLTSGLGSKFNPQFSSDGTKIYYISGGDLFEVPALGGVSRKIFERAGPFAISSHDEIAFYRPGTGTSPSPITILPVGGGVSESWHPECVAFGPPTWSPRGDRLAFVGFCGKSQKPAILLGPRNGGTLQVISAMSLEQFGRPTWFRLRNGTEGLLFSSRSGDSTNLFRMSLDGTQQRVTSGTGLEVQAAVSLSGELIFSRGESSSAVWSLPLSGGEKPRKETAPATYFASSPDGAKLVFGRMLGAVHGELVLRDRATETETVLASHDVAIYGAGSFWPQVSPDGKRVIYRTITNPLGISLYLVSIDGGTARLFGSKDFAVASDWSPDGTRVIGECNPVSNGICELDPTTGKVHPLLKDFQGGELLYPSFSWDGKWVAFMWRRGGRTVIGVTPVRREGSLAGEAEWIRISSEDINSSRPRFAPDGASLYYLIGRGPRVLLVRQQLDPASKKPSGDPVQLVSIPFSGLGVSLVSVTRDRVFYNTSEARSNLWMTHIE